MLHFIRKAEMHMNIKPVSDLRNYPLVLSSVSEGNPVYLTKNGRGTYVILDIKEQEEQQYKANEYDRLKAELNLICEINAGKYSGENDGWISIEEVRAHFKELTDEG